LRAEVLGQATYGIDVRLSGLAYSAVAHPQSLKESCASGGRGCRLASAGVLKFQTIGLAVSLMRLNMTRRRGGKQG
jgi:hypothetical protein